LRCRRIVAASIVLIVVGPSVRASDECSAAFAQWVKLSEVRIRNSGTTSGTSSGPDKRAPAACIPSEQLRQELLQALKSTRDTCAGSVAGDQAAQHTRMMIDINESFIASVALCRTESQAGKPGREVAKRVARPRQCLGISRLTSDHYVISNRRCNGTRVLAVIETQKTTGVTACKAYTISEKMTVPTAEKLPPTLNYECALDQEECTKERVAVMFPECEW
jgi:hypothetical protein